MAHWAELDDNNYVIRVTVGSNDDPDEGYQWLIDNLGGRWVKTSYTSYGGKRRDPITNEPIDEPAFRYNFAATGFTYDPIKDAFIPPKPDPIMANGVIAFDWQLNPDTCLWESFAVKPTE